jgi:hypothetical protein
MGGFNLGLTDDERFQRTANNLFPFAESFLQLPASDEPTIESGTTKTIQQLQTFCQFHLCAVHAL